MDLEQYRTLIGKARRQGRYGLIDYLRYRMQNRKAMFTEIKHKYSLDGLKIIKTIEKEIEKKVTYNDFLKLNGERICIN